MDAIPFYFDSVKRTALVVKCKKPFYDWLEYLDPADKIFSDESDSHVYLLPDFDDSIQGEKWLKKNFDDIFSDQLNNWYIDETLWPQKRTFKIFKDWFEYSLHIMVSDTLDGPIEKIV
jgi:hypothetical protein